MRNRVKRWDRIDRSIDRWMDDRNGGEREPWEERSHAFAHRLMFASSDRFSNSLPNSLRPSALQDLEELMGDVSTTGRGVHVQASTLGALEALMDFLRNCSIPVGSINIGPVHKRDVMKASIMCEKAPEYAMVLAFDVKIMPVRTASHSPNIPCPRQQPFRCL